MFVLLSTVPLFAASLYGIAFSVKKIIKYYDDALESQFLGALFYGFQLCVSVAVLIIALNSLLNCT